MGHRTQILIIKENKDKERKAYFLHNQWGYGRTMYLALMDVVLQDYTKDTYIPDYDFLRHYSRLIKTSNQFTDITPSVPFKVLAEADVTDFKTIQEVFRYGDNNNGGLVLHFKEGCVPYEMSKISYGFLLGRSDAMDFPNEKAFDRWLTIEEYGRLNEGRRLSDKEFTKMIQTFCDYFEVSFLGKTEEENED